jgi:hypothetical protein
MTAVIVDWFINVLIGAMLIGACWSVAWLLVKLWNMLWSILCWVACATMGWLADPEEDL